MFPKVACCWPCRHCWRWVCCAIPRPCTSYPTAFTGSPAYFCCWPCRRWRALNRSNSCATWRPASGANCWGWTPRQHRFTLVFDREAYSPEFFAAMRLQHIAILTYHKYPGGDWPVEEFAAGSVRLASGEEVTMKLAERGTRLSKHLSVRQVRQLYDHSQQTCSRTT